MSGRRRKGKDPLPVPPADEPSAVQPTPVERVEATPAVRQPGVPRRRARVPDWAREAGDDEVFVDPDPHVGADEVPIPAAPSPSRHRAEDGRSRKPETAPFLVDLPVTSPASRSESRRARHESRVRRWRLVGAGAGAVVLAVVAGVLLWPGGDSPAGTGDTAATQGRSQSTLLVQLAGPGGNAVGSALLAHDTRSGKGAGVLVPSRLIADVPGQGSLPFGEALGLVGGTLSADTLTDLLGVTVDGTWVLREDSMTKLVDELGGVTVDVDAAVTRTDDNGDRVVIVDKGTQRLNGADATAYGTFLGSGEPEQARLSRFKDVLAASVAELPDDPAEMQQVLASLGDGSRPTLASDRLGEFLDGLRRDDAADRLEYQILPTRTIDTGGKDITYGLDQQGASKLVGNLLAGSVPDGPSDGPVRVLVQNGVGTPGLGEKARTKLVDSGFRFVNGGNADDFNHETSAVVIMDGTRASRAQGSAVASALGLPAGDLRVSPTGQTVADVIVILGNDFEP